MEEEKCLHLHLRLKCVHLMGTGEREISIYDNRLTKTEVWFHHIFFLVLYSAFSVKTLIPYYDKSAGEILLNWILDIYYMTLSVLFLEREEKKKRSKHVSKKTVQMSVGKDSRKMTNGHS